MMGELRWNIIVNLFIFHLLKKKKKNHQIRLVLKMVTEHVI